MGSPKRRRLLFEAEAVRMLARSGAYSNGRWIMPHPRVRTCFRSSEMVVLKTIISHFSTGQSSLWLSRKMMLFNGMRTRRNC